MVPPLRLKQESVAELLSDYSIFHPSVAQLEMIYDLSAKYAQYLGIDQVVARLIYLRSVIKYQQEKQVFHFENDANLPQFKLVRSTRLNELIMDNTLDLVEQTGDLVHEMISKSIDRIFRDYIDNYAIRDPT